MFTWIGDAVDLVIATYVSNVLAGVVIMLAPIVAAGQVLWMTLFGYAVMRGEVREPVNTAVWQTVKILFLCSVALGAATYNTYVVDIVDGLTLGMVANFMPSSSVVSVTSIWSVLNGFNDSASDLVLKAIEADHGITFPDLMPWFAAFLFSVGNCILLIVAFCVTLWVKTVQAFVLGIGPVFIIALGFRQTARFFDGWLSVLLSTVVLTWLVYFVLGFSIGIGGEYIRKLLTDFSALDLVAEALSYVVLLVAFAFLLYQSPSFAAGLTGGGPGQYGAGLVQQTLITYRMARGSGGRRPDPSQPATAQSNTVARSGGFAYRAGQAATSWGQRAYQVAARRGRR